MALVLALAAGGCASAGSTSSTSSSSTPGAAGHTATSLPGGSFFGGTDTNTTAASTPTAHDHHRRAPVTPSAPGGLNPTAGYATYEGCQGTCTGAVPAALRRALNLPGADGGPCPVTLRAGGPVDESGSTQIGFRRMPGSRWLSAALTWTAKAYYSGPVLIRGRQVGGGAAIGFGQRATPYDELQLHDAGAGAPRAPNGGRAWLTDARITAPGCYAFQVDGTNFSEVFVFRAVG